MAETLDPKTIDLPPQQDLGLSLPHGMDAAVPRGDMPKPDARRLAEPSSRVWAFNTDLEQTHIVMDRFLVGQELLPGQGKEMELLNRDIEYFVRQRKPHSVSRIVDNRVETIIVRHPVEIRDEHGSVLQPRYASKASPAPEQSSLPPLSSSPEPDNNPTPAPAEPTEGNEESAPATSKPRRYGKQ